MKATKMTGMSSIQVIMSDIPLMGERISKD